MIHDTQEEKTETEESGDDVVVEALPDIESGAAHALGSKEPLQVSEEDASSAGEGEVEQERESKRVKLDADDAVGVDASEGNQDASKATTPAEATTKQDVEEDSFDLRMTWAGQGFDFRVQASDRIYDFKV